MNKKLKIYLAGPIRSVNQENYVISELRKFLPRYGEVLTEGIGWDSPGEYHLSDNEIYQRDIKMLNEADIMIAECSSPSHGVGLEIAYAIYVRKIPVILLRSNDVEGKLSAMLLGNDLLQDYVINYDNLDQLLVDLDVKIFFIVDQLTQKAEAQFNHLANRFT